jgi:sugar phosphate isomerase/epimerase
VKKRKARKFTNVESVGDMKLSICSYSFHQLLKDGQQDMFGYIRDCKTLGVTHLEPWNGHFAAPDIEQGQPPLLSNAAHLEYVQSIKQAADAAQLPFGCLAVDGAHIYEKDEKARQANKKRASQWLEVAAYLGVKQVRVDSGYQGEVWPEDVFTMIVDGYHELIAEAQAKGLEIIIENHWGPSQHPEQLVKLLGAVDGLGLLFDTHNWAKGKQQQGWDTCAKYARAVHIKTFSFDEQGNDPTVDLHKAIAQLHQAGYGGIWGIESVPEDGGEFDAAQKTIVLLKRVLVELGESSA